MSAGGDVLVRARGLRKHYGSLEVLRGVDLTVRRGEVVVLLGASGAGKSTLLRCVNHLEAADGGEIWVDDVPIGFRHEGRLRQARRHVSGHVPDGRADSHGSRRSVRKGDYDGRHAANTGLHSRSRLELQPVGGWLEMVGTGGIEPPTSCVSSRRSNP